MNTNTIKAATAFVKNKAVAIAATIVAAIIYVGLQSPSGSPLPFLELLYGIVLLSAVGVLAPLLRLFIFPEAAEYAESGALREDLAQQEKTNGLLHYWFATAVCWTAAIVAISGLL
jgi:hypothetical protein